MAQLESPGVSVSVIDESFYTPAAPGTVPMIFMATASNKANASGTGTAIGTLPANAGKVWTITSQRDLVDTFGTPRFQTDASGNPFHGGELNEYGLQAAYSLLGVSNRVYAVRADVDLGQLTAKNSEPVGNPPAGTWWLDSDSSKYGISVWDASTKTFTPITPLIVDNSNVADVTSGGFPLASFGSVGDYAMVVTSANTNTLFYKNSDNAWVVVGSNQEEFSTGGFTSTCWATSFPVATSKQAITSLPENSFSFKINGVEVLVPAGSSLATVAGAVNLVMSDKGVGARVVDNKLALYSDVNSASNGTVADGAILLEESDPNNANLSLLGLTAGLHGGVLLHVQPHTRVPRFAQNKNASGSMYIKTTSFNGGAFWTVSLFNGTGTFNVVPSPIYGSAEEAIFNLDKAGGKNLVTGSLYIHANYEGGDGTPGKPVLAQFKLMRRNASSPTKISYTVPTSFISFNVSTASTFQIRASRANRVELSDPVTVTIPAAGTLQDFVAAISAAKVENVSAVYDATARVITISHKLGGEIRLLDGTNSPLTGAGSTALGFSAFNSVTKTGTLNLYATGVHNTDGFTLVASNWRPLSYLAQATQPTSRPEDGQLWHSGIVSQVDIMYHNGTTWVGYLNAFPLTDPNGPQVAALAPATQSTGGDLVDGDLWISTADPERYGKDVYVWSSDLVKWVLQDTSDNTSTNGWLFADARYSTAGQNSSAATIKELLSSDYLDPDAPDPALYPEGMRLWNLRRSGFNVKRYVRNYINVNANGGLNIRFTNDVMDGTVSGVKPYFADRWVTASPNDERGVGSFGRHAQRSFVVAGLKALIDTNTAARDTDILNFNLISTPGYPETIQNMIAFNADRGYTGFVVGDSPFRLASSGTALSEWSQNVNGAFDNNDVGAVSFDEFCAMYYPSGLTTDNLGNSIVVPPSHMMLRTIARSDAVSYPWFAPAGLRRGGVDNATSVGYVDPNTGEFVLASLPESIRDVMAKGKLNPIATLPGSGITVMGQYTRAKTASALDRVNVARLVCFLRRQLGILARPFLFEPNDKITRSEVKNSIESLLLELVGQRAISDFIVRCDETNNTAARIDRNELHVDVLFVPVRSTEFIFIPIRIKNTGSITSGG